MHITTILFTLCFTSSIPEVTSSAANRHNYHTTAGRGRVDYLAGGGMRKGSIDTAGSTQIISGYDDEHVTDYYRGHRSQRNVLDNDSINEPNDDDLRNDDYLDHEFLLTVHHRHEKSGGIGNQQQQQLLDHDDDSWNDNTNDNNVYNESSVVANTNTATVAATAFVSRPRHARSSVPAVRGGSIVQVGRRHDNEGYSSSSSSNNRSSGNGRGGRYYDDDEKEYQSKRSSSRQQRHQRHQNTQRRLNQSSSRAFTPRRSMEREFMSPSRRSRHGRQTYLKESNVVDYDDDDDVPTCSSSSDHDSDDYDHQQQQQQYDHDNNTSNHNDYYNTPSTSASATQSNLLRLPLQLHLNTPTTSSSQQYHSSTPIAAYVDTGAQVTVISASAARKVGILHLIDRRYAGRATGVGECRVLGRIDAGCVKFILGDDDDDDCCRSIDESSSSRNDESGRSNNRIEMEGPALTVLEGTVTPGVDMLLGLDVLQDWEATIQIGKRRSCIMVRKRGLVDPVVLPFMVESNGGGGDGGGKQGGRRRRVKHNVPRYDDEGRDRRRRYRSISKQQKQQQHVIDVKEDDDQDEFSPVSSDIESDLDILDQSEFTHEFPDKGRSRRRVRCSDEIVQDIERENELLGVVRHSRHLVRDEEEEELEDSSDEEEENFDMSGL